MTKRPGDKQVRRYFNPRLFRRSSHTDADIDRMIASAERRLEGIARQDLALRHAADVSDVVSVRYPNLLVAPLVPGGDVKVQIGRDGQFRFSSYSFHNIFVTRYHLSTYTATWNMITDAIGEGDWEEWPYRHIVSVEAATISEEVAAHDRKSRKRLKKHGPQQVVSGYFFAIRNAGGGELYASIQDKVIRPILEDEKLAEPNKLESRLEAMSELAQHFKSCQRRLRDVLRDHEAATDPTVDQSPIPSPPAPKPRDAG